MYTEWTLKYDTLMSWWYECAHRTFAYINYFLNVKSKECTLTYLVRSVQSEIMHWSIHRKSVHCSDVHYIMHLSSVHRGHKGHYCLNSSSVLRHHPHLYTSVRYSTASWPICLVTALGFWPLPVIWTVALAEDRGLVPRRCSAFGPHLVLGHAALAKTCTAQFQNTD